MRITQLVRSVFLVLLMLAALPAISSADIVLTIGIAPPELPIYDQPICPGDGYIWTPGYWAYDSDQGYFWVPGTWVEAPETGFLWTPGYWGWGEDAYVFHEGFWGLQIGFYGGINYGFGYVGVGYEGGYWNNGAFFYNRSVNNVEHVTNVYVKTVNVTVNNVSYNGPGGAAARPTPQEQAAANGRHIAATSVQTEHVRTASTNKQLYESVNHGKPAIAATAKPGQFSGGVVAAKAAAPSYKPVEARSATAPGHPSPAANAKPETPADTRTAVHPNELAPAARPEAPKTGDAETDQKLQQEQSSLNAKQELERQQLQKQQEQEHQQAAQRPAPELEQKHQQQTQQLAQKHAQEQQQLQQKQQHAAPPPKEKH